MYRNMLCATLIIVMTLVNNACSLAIRNYETTSYPYSTYPSTYQSVPSTTISPLLTDRSSSLYGNSFANPTSLTSFFSPDRYSHLNNFLSPPNYGGIKLIPPALTNHFYHKFPTTKYPVTSLAPSQPSSSHYAPLSTPSSHMPTSASFESMDSSPVIVRPKKPTRRPLTTSSLYETSSHDTIPISHTSSPILPQVPTYQHDLPSRPTTPISTDLDSPPGSLGLLYVCK